MLRTELEQMGKQVYYVGINITNAEDYQGNLTAKTSFPMFQDLSEVNVWGLHGAGKDDFLLFDKNGKLVQHLPIGGMLNIDLSSVDGYRNVKNAILAIP